LIEACELCIKGGYIKRCRGRAAQGQRVAAVGGTAGADHIAPKAVAILKYKRVAAAGKIDSVRARGSVAGQPATDARGIVNRGTTTADNSDATGTKSTTGATSATAGTAGNDSRIGQGEVTADNSGAAGTP
jgi:hypothetical protein